MQTKKRVGLILIVIGVFLVLASLGILIHNEYESRQAENRSRKEVERLRSEINGQSKEQSKDASEGEPKEEKDSGKAGNIDDAYIGIITIPAVGVEVPVTSDYNEETLKQMPCRYYGSADEGNLVIAGHNYRHGFGELNSLSGGDEVILTEMDGNIRHYVVREREVLKEDDISGMNESGWDLSLYTCTYSGRERLTVRCREE